MRDYLMDLLYARLAEHDLWDADSLEAVRTWLLASEGRKPVVVVGSGFSRNAGFAGGLPADRLPLWGDIVGFLKAQLYIGHEAAPTVEIETDPLRLAQLYVDHFDRCALVNGLANLIDDAALEPQEAHRALFSYPVEAVVTTNQLDTLLDKNEGRWTRVVEDPDLSRHLSGGPTPQLIYLHGHREQPKTWVFTQNEYEDVFRTRPAIVTRVRQLFAQFPVLLVGYGLGDPDFHAIYRHVSMDMQRSQPMGLAVLLRKPHKAVRTHWEKLGIRLAVLKCDATESWRKTNGSLAQFFSLSPVRHRPLGGLVDLLDGMKSRSSFEGRLQFLEDYWNDPAKDKAIDVLGSAQVDFRLWNAVAEPEFTKSELSELREWQPPEIRELLAKTSDAKGRPPRSQTSAKALQFEILPTDRFGSLPQMNRTLDLLLQRTRGRWSHVARWLWRGLAMDMEGPGRSDCSPPMIANLTSWLWTTLARPGAQARVGEALPSSPLVEVVLRRCLYAASKFVDGPAMEAVADDARTLGLQVTTSDLPALLPQPALEACLEGAFQLVMDNANAGAFDAYGHAAELAEHEGDGFRQWVAALARLRLYWRLHPERGAATDAELKSLRTRVSELEELPEVAAWLRTARRREREILKKRVEQMEEEERRRIWGSERLFFDNTIYYYWLSFRDLQTSGAVPSQQKPFVENLVRAHAYSSADEELQYRLLFDLEGTKNWIETVAGETRPADLDKRKARDRKLVGRVLASPEHVTGWAPRLISVPAAIPLMLEEEVALIPSFLEQCRARIGVDRSAGLWAERSLYSVYPEAWLAWAGLCDAEQSLRGLAAYEQTVKHTIERSYLLRGLVSLPWRMWSLASPQGAGLHLSFLTSFLERLPPEATFDDEHASVMWAGLEIAKAAKAAPAGDGWLPVKELASSIASERDVRWDVWRAAILLLQQLGAFESTSSLVETVEAAVSARLGPRKASEGDNGFEMGCAIASDLRMAGLPQSELSTLSERLEERFGEEKETLLPFLRANPTSATHFVRFLVDSLRRGKPAKDADIAAALLQVLHWAPLEVEFLSDCLHPLLWGADWGKLVDYLAESAQGTIRGGGVHGQIAVLGLLNALLKRRVPDLPTEMQWLLALAPVLVSHDNPLVAQRAALCVARLARLEPNDPSRVPFLLSALRRTAGDPRTEVRTVAARSVLGLASKAMEQQVRSTASELLQRLEADPYAMIQCALRRSRCDREVVAEGAVAKEEERDEGDR